MRDAFVLATALAASVLIPSGPAATQAERLYPYCFTQNNAIGLGGAHLCHYISFEQCREVTSGLGGQCVENPEVVARQQRQSRPKPVR